MKIKVSGWSGINHSYSIIAESYIKGISNRAELYFEECKYYNASWKKKCHSLLDDLPIPSESDIFDINLRFTYPYNLIPDPNSRLTVVFMTCEHNYISDNVDTSNLCDNIWILTPSDYSKRGIIASGVDELKIIVISHCYDYINPCLSKSQLRDKYNIPQNDYVFFHNSSITGNKNVSSIIKCFELVYRFNANISLLIKGLDNTYGSHNKLVEILQLLQRNLNLTSKCKIIYIGNDFTQFQMGELYELSDCYVSPFLAEGFNLPIIEALCHGLQVICTKGGPPDEFAMGAFLIASQWCDSGDELVVNGNSVPKLFLNPDVIELFDKMFLVLSARNNIDKQYFISKFSSNNIGTLLYHHLDNLLSRENILSTVPDIVLLEEDGNYSEIIDNIRTYCGNVKIYIGISTNANYVNTNLINHLVVDDLHHEQIYEPIVGYDSIICNKIYKIKFIMDKARLNNVIFISNKVILFADPRTIFQKYMRNACNNHNKILINDNRMYALCINRDISIYQDVPIYPLNSYLQLKYKWIIPKNRGFGCYGVLDGRVGDGKLLYVCTQDQCKYSIAQLAINDTNLMSKLSYLHLPDTNMTAEKLLGQSQVAIITDNLIKKYQKILRCAPLTLLFYEKDKHTGIDNILLSSKSIFVYPEILEFFFQIIYQFLSEKFILNTLNCDFIQSKKYVEYDTKLLICECNFVDM